MDFILTHTSEDLTFVTIILWKGSQEEKIKIDRNSGSLLFNQRLLQSGRHTLQTCIRAAIHS